MATVVLLGTCDTKLEELLFLRSQILHHGKVEVLLFDVGRHPVKHGNIYINQNNLFAKYGVDKGRDNISRGDFIKEISECATLEIAKLYKSAHIHGIVAAGGSGGTSLAAAVMRDALPIGFPKLLISTIASGDTGPLVGETDISMMYSVVDISGLNGLLRDILRNAGAAIAASALAYATSKEDKSTMITPASEAESSSSKRRVGMTMFGVTTQGVDAIRKHLESKYPIEVYVFHATGHGGKAMERLVREGRLDAVLDLTTTEICDYITGGNMSAGPSRLEAAAQAGIPYVVSLGATDMSNFGQPSTVPAEYRDRKLYEHNPVVTLMRSSEEESRLVGEFISNKLRTYGRQPKNIEVWLPTGGVSQISIPGGPFEDLDADKALFSTVKEKLEGSGIVVVEDSRNVNDDGFAVDIAEALAVKMNFE